MRKVAVIGTGNFGMKHAAALRAVGAEPILVPVRRVRVEALRAAGWRAEPTLAAAREAGARLCVVATDTGRHERDARAALRLGMDVLCEKPLAPGAPGARRILDEARRLRRRLAVGCVLRVSRSLLEFRRLLPRIGRVHAVSIECRSYLPDWVRGRDYKRRYSAQRAEGGVLRDLIHEVDYAGWLFGWPRVVWGRVVNLGRLGIAADERAELSWTAPGGASVTIGLDYLTRAARRRMTADGERGSLEWDGISDRVRLRLAGRREASVRLPMSRETRLKAQARSFLAGGRGLCDGRDGARALAVCDAARFSTRSRRECRAALA